MLTESGVRPIRYGYMADVWMKFVGYTLEGDVASKDRKYDYRLFPSPSARL